MGRRRPRPVGRSLKPAEARGFAGAVISCIALCEGSIPSPPPRKASIGLDDLRSHTEALGRVTSFKSRSYHQSLIAVQAQETVNGLRKLL